MNAVIVEQRNAVATGPTLAYGKTKELYNRALHDPLETQMEEERQAIAESARTVDFREGVAAFFGKRKAEFRGE